MKTVILLKMAEECTPKLLHSKQIRVIRPKKECSADQIIDVCFKKTVDAVFISNRFRQAHHRETTHIIRELYRMGGTVILEGKVHTGSLISEKFLIGGDCYTRISINQMLPTDEAAKRLLDICGACVGIPIAGLVLLISGPAIKHVSPGPVLFKQTRYGKNGKPFTFYKIRTMEMGAEKARNDLWDQNEMDAYMFKIGHDPRIIPGIGEFLRKTSLDEFPQFVNVLKGDMSIVGARPPIPDEYAKYRHHHKARLAMKPGITGPWQVSGRNEITNFEDIVRMDTDYIKNWTLGTDIRLILQTVVAVLSGRGAE